MFSWSKNTLQYFNVLWQIAVAPQFKQHMNQSFFHIYLKLRMNIRTHFISTAERHQYIIFLSIHKYLSFHKHIHNIHKSTEVIYSPVWFVCQTRWRILRYDWSDRMSIKLFVKGQLSGLGVFDKSWSWTWLKSWSHYNFCSVNFHLYIGKCKKQWTQAQWPDSWILLNKPEFQRMKQNKSDLV